MASTLLKAIGIIIIFPFSSFFMFMGLFLLYDLKIGHQSNYGMAVGVVLMIPALILISIAFGILGIWLIKKYSKK